ncbi:hypothetical protein HRbin37_01821 [bacterium HR37]|nr:hypothetical protein HRbin37_01821 [bacterium HR37]
MIWIQRVISISAGISVVLVGIYLQGNIPTVGASGEAVSIAGKFYPTALVLWVLWLVTITISALFVIYGTRPK